MADSSGGSAGYECHKKEMLGLKRSLAEMINEHIRSRDGEQDERQEQQDEREERLNTWEETLNARQEDLERRENAVKEAENADEPPPPPKPQWTRVKAGWREVCSTCKVNFCSRPGDCSEHTDNHHNCARCHRDWAQYGFKGKQWMKAENKGGKGKKP
ncbi:unnamed protein product [Symbiodinium sp. CCMP2592]|nr:unnamed protein product [Symbiodinium sp. CCMP2592]CAE7707486.1 unnamed protein product [Symbiodinium sp. CCMP2592]CAE7836047.1 unnamed protein product [Symbiodinium sp. CCMP2592]